MKKIVLITILAVIACGVITVVNISDSNNLPYKYSGVLGAQIMAANGQLIDVREKAEYATEHANGAVNVPLSEIKVAKFSGIDKTKPVYVYCKSGVRAALAKKLLEKAGYTNVTNIGGLTNWQNQGGSVCRTNKVSC